MENHYLAFRALRRQVEQLLKQAIINGLIAWESTYRVRTDLIEECLILLEYLRREVEEDTVERRNMPHISGFPHLFVVKDSLERIESLLLPYVKNVS